MDELEAVKTLIGNALMKKFTKRKIKYNDEGITEIRKSIAGALRGIRWNGFEWVNWRKEKRRKRKLALLNMKQMRLSSVEIDKFVSAFRKLKDD